MLGNSARTIRGVPGVRFWHLLVGLPGFAIGGGELYPSALKYESCESREQKNPGNLGNDWAGRVTSE